MLGTLLGFLGTLLTIQDLAHLVHASLVVRSPPDLLRLPPDLT